MGEWDVVSTAKSVDANNSGDGWGVVSTQPSAPAGPMAATADKPSFMRDVVGKTLSDIGYGTMRDIQDAGQVAEGMLDPTGVFGRTMRGQIKSTDYALPGSVKEAGQQLVAGAKDVAAPYIAMARNPKSILEHPVTALANVGMAAGLVGDGMGLMRGGTPALDVPADVASHLNAAENSFKAFVPDERAATLRRMATEGAEPQPKPVMERPAPVAPAGPTPRQGTFPMGQGERPQAPVEAPAVPGAEMSPAVENAEPESAQAPEAPAPETPELPYEVMPGKGKLKGRFLIFDRETGEPVRMGKDPLSAGTEDEAHKIAGTIFKAPGTPPSETGQIPPPASSTPPGDVGAGGTVPRGEQGSLLPEAPAPVKAAPAGPRMLDEETPYLDDFVRRNGGLKSSDADLPGELRRLSLKEGINGIINNNTGLTVDDMFERAKEAGLVDPETNRGDFLYQIERARFDRQESEARNAHNPEEDMRAGRLINDLNLEPGDKVKTPEDTYTYEGTDKDGNERFKDGKLVKVHELDDLPAEFAQAEKVETKASPAPKGDLFGDVKNEGPTYQGKLDKARMEAEMKAPVNGAKDNAVSKAGAEGTLFNPPMPDLLDQKPVPEPSKPIPQEFVFNADKQQKPAPRTIPDEVQAVLDGKVKGGGKIRGTLKAALKAANKQVSMDTTGMSADEAIDALKKRYEYAEKLKGAGGLNLDKTQADIARQAEMGGFTPVGRASTLPRPIQTLLGREGKYRTIGGINAPRAVSMAIETIARDNPDIFAPKTTIAKVVEAAQKDGMTIEQIKDDFNNKGKLYQGAKFQAAKDIATGCAEDYLQGLQDFKAGKLSGEELEQRLKNTIYAEGNMSNTSSGAGLTLRMTQEKANPRAPLKAAERVIEAGKSAGLSNEDIADVVAGKGTGNGGSGEGGGNGSGGVGTASGIADKIRRADKKGVLSRSVFEKFMLKAREAGLSKDEVLRLLNEKDAAPAGTAPSTMDILEKANPDKLTMERETFRNLLQKAEKAGLAPQEIAEALHGLDVNDPKAVDEYLRTINKPNWWDKGMEYYRGSIFSGVPTFVVKTTSDTTNIILKPFQDTAAGVIDMTRKNREVYAGEGLQAAGEAWKHLKQAISDGKREVWRAITTQNGIQNGVARFWSELKDIDVEKMLNEYGTRRAIRGTKGDIIRIPVNTLGLVTRMAGDVFRDMEVGTQAYRMAMKEGARGAELEKAVDGHKAHINAILDDPAMTEADAKELGLDQYFKPAESVKAEMKRGTFTEDVGTLGKLFNKARHLKDPITGAKPGELLMPVLNIGVNLSKRAFNESPVGFIKPMLMKSGIPQAEWSRAMGRAAVGTTLMAGFGKLAMDGTITGKNPPPGRQRYSVKFGDQDISYQRLGSIGMQMGMIADAYQAMQAGVLKEQSWTAIATQTALGFGSVLMDESFMRSAHDFMEALTDTTGNKWAKLAGLEISGIIPNFFAKGANVIDPGLKDSRTALDTIMGRIPFAKNELPTRIDWAGRPVMMGGTGAERFASPFYRNEISKDPVDKELAKLGMTLHPPKRKVGDKVLDPKAYSAYAQDAGQAVYKAVSDYINSPGYKTDSIDDRRYNIHRAQADAHKDASDRFKKTGSAAVAESPAPAGRKTWGGE